MSSKTKLQITSIVCNAPSEGTHLDGLLADEVYIYCQCDGLMVLRYPTKLGTATSMTKGDTLSFDGTPFVLDFEHEALVTLWDCDVTYYATVSTYLVSNDYTPADATGEKATNIKNPNGADYTIYTRPYVESAS